MSTAAIHENQASAYHRAVADVLIAQGTDSQRGLSASEARARLETYGPNELTATMAFTTLVMFQLFNIFNARSDERSAFHGLFKNHWLWGAILLSLGAHVAVIYVPFLQEAFSTVSLTFLDWLCCAGAGSSVLWLRELQKLLVRH